MNLGKRWIRNITKDFCVILIIAVGILTGCSGQVADSEEPSSSPAGTAALSEMSSVKAEVQSEADQANKRTGEKEASELHADEPEEMLRLYVNDDELSVVWEDNDAVDALRELVSKEPLVIEMSMYGGFEQVGSIGKELPQNDIEITTNVGDIVLYSGDQIVIFYGSNTWSYTKLGHVENKTEKELTQMLGQNNVSIKIENPNNQS